MPLTGKQVASHVLALFLMGGSVALAGDPAVLKPRVPPDRIEEAKTWQNPFPLLPNVLNEAKNFFMAKGFA